MFLFGPKVGNLIVSYWGGPKRPHFGPFVQNWATFPGHTGSNRSNFVKMELVRSKRMNEEGESQPNANFVKWQKRIELG